MNVSLRNTLILIGVILLIIGGAYFLRGQALRTSSGEGTQDTLSDQSFSQEGVPQELTNPLQGNDTLLPTSSSSSPTKTMEHYTQATLKTSQGDIVISLNQETPHTVENFIKLAQSGFYDGTKFHRVIKDFMIQGGDPLTKDDTQQARWGTGGPGYQFADEITAQNNNEKGTLAMANAGPNTNGSQFFINVHDNSFLNTKHTVFGKVIKGYDLVEKMSMVPTDQSDRPLTPLVIIGVELK